MSEATVEGIGPLNLSDADTTQPSFEVIPSGRTLRAEVFDITPTKIEKEGGTLAQGTPGYKVQVKVLNEGEGSEFYNRRIFNNYWLPGEDHDKEKAAKMRGMFVNFLVALGYSKEEVMSGSFSVDEDDIRGREFAVVTGVQPARKDEEGNELYPAQNTIRGVKTLEEAGKATTSSLL